MMRWLAIGLLVSAAVWGALVYWGPETRQVRLIHEEGNDMFCDFRMPRQCAQADNPYRAETVDKKDRCYPITGYVLAALFPEDFFRGGRGDFEGRGVVVADCVLSASDSAWRWGDEPVAGESGLAGIDSAGFLR